MTDTLRECWSSYLCGTDNLHKCANGSMHWILCDNCGATGPTCFDEENAILEWNNRPIEDELIALLDSCQQYIEDVPVLRVGVAEALAKAKGNT